MRTHHILIGYTCFGVGMLIGQGLANSILWVAATIIAAVACLVIAALINKPRKKRLPVRRTTIVESKPRRLKAVR